MSVAIARESDGLIVSMISDDTAARSTSPAGMTRIALADDVDSVVGLVWKGGKVFEPLPPPVMTRLSRLAFRELFTAAERAAVRSLEKNGDPDIEDAVDAMRLAEYVDRADPRVAGYLSLLVAKGVLTAARRTAVLSGEAP